MHPLGQIVVAASVLFIIAPPAAGHETDNYTVPPGRAFADLGSFFTNWFYDAIVEGVETSNARIRSRIERGGSPEDLAPLQTPDAIARDVRRAFPPTLSMIDDLDRRFRREEMRCRYPGRILQFKQFSCIYDHSSFPLDPRQIFKLWRAPIVKVGGTYLGLDKIGHFVAKGHISYGHYRRAVRRGTPPEEAVREVVILGTEGDFFYSEKRMVGYFSSGVYSNADLVADWAGFKFFRNLTEPEMFSGALRPPLLERNGPYWKLAEYVRRDSDFFTDMISDHFNEVLNPNLYQGSMRKPVRKAIRKRGAIVLECHADINGQRRTKQHFDDLIDEYATYFGEDYGRDGSYEDRMCLGHTLFDEMDDDAPLDVRDNQGRTILHRAAARDDTALLARLLDQRADVDADVEVRSDEPFSSEWGSTPLHYAARDGRLGAARLLMQHGADVNHANDRGAMPLHRATQRPDTAAFLIEAGADINAADALGRTPLHWAVRYGSEPVVALLLQRGAALDARDNDGWTPLHHAASLGHRAAAAALIDGGADPRARGRFGVTPLHVAAGEGRGAIVDLLAGAGIELDVSDEFGWTALHAAAQGGHLDAAERLVAVGADVNMGDSRDNTPLHLAARFGYAALARTLADAGADVNAANRLGLTALHEAGAKGYRLVAETLLARGADPAAAGPDGLTPVALARANRHGHIVRILLAYANNETGPVSADLTSQE